MEDVIQRIQEFLMPVVEAIDRGVSFDRRWTPGKGWQE